MIKFLVKGQNIETLEHEVIAADQIAFVKNALPRKPYKQDSILRYVGNL